MSAVAKLPTPPASESDLGLAPVASANEDMRVRRSRHDLRVEVVPVTASERNALAATFWHLLGDLTAEVLLDGAHGPWEDLVSARMADEGDAS